MSLEASAIHFWPVLDAMVEWSAEAAHVEAIGEGVPGLVEFAPPVVSGPPGKVEAITAAALAAIAGGALLPDGTIYNVTDGGFLAVPRSASTFRRFYAIEIGPTAPDDPHAIWLETDT